MPISEKQLEANRRNSIHSTGPRTAKGKARSSRNNLRHGLTGQVTVLPAEDREAHDAFRDRLLTSLSPETPLEQQLAQSIAEDSWRLNRVSAIEANMFALGRDGQHGEIRCALAEARYFADHAREFNLLSLYEQRIHRNLQRNLSQLRELQAEREAARRRQMEEAKLLAQHSLANGLAFDPAQNGFEFSTAEINLAIDRDNRLNEARLASRSAPNRPASRAAVARAA